MELDGAFRNLKVRGDLFVQLAPDQMPEDFAFARGQSLVPFAELVLPVTRAARLFVLSKRALHCGQKGLRIHGLGQEVHRTAPDRAYRVWNRAMAAHEHDRNRHPSPGQRSLQIETAIAV